MSESEDGAKPHICFHLAIVLVDSVPRHFLSYLPKTELTNISASELALGVLVSLHRDLMRLCEVGTKGAEASHALALHEGRIGLMVDVNIDACVDVCIFVKKPCTFGISQLQVDFKSTSSRLLSRAESPGTSRRLIESRLA